MTKTTMKAPLTSKRPKSELTDLNGVNGEDRRTRAVVLHPYLKSGNAGGRAVDSRLEEAVGLAAAIDLNVVAAETVALAKMNAGTYFGKGTVERLHELVEEQYIDLVSVDASLSPVQQRMLEKAWGAKVIDRTGLILEIFGERAATREGVLQVELAHLDYQRSRLVRTWTHLERQRGGFGFLGGPGETQIEADRRMISERITKIRRELETVTRTRELHREARRRVPYPVVALVGYTNAGKSTLFNKLTDAKVFAKDLLFATLDPTMREIKLPSGRSVILSDTVGFVSDLPTTLIAAFRATLEELLEADLVVHVRDIANPETEAQKADVEGYPDVAALFRSVAEGETGHAHGHLEYLAEVGDPASGEPIGDTEDNLKASVAGETYEYTQMYPGFAKTARDEGFDEIAEWFETLARAEKSHAGRFTQGLESVS